jgi:hypothetical protein
VWCAGYLEWCGVMWCTVVWCAQAFVVYNHFPSLTYSPSLYTFTRHDIPQNNSHPSMSNSKSSGNSVYKKINILVFYTVSYLSQHNLFVHTLHRSCVLSILCVKCNLAGNDCHYLSGHMSTGTPASICLEKQPYLVTF